MLRRHLLLGATLLAGCAPTPEQQAAALSPPDSTGATRARETRRFDTANTQEVLRAAVGALQDSGFTIEETQAEYGMVTASKISGGNIRVQVVVRRVPDQAATTVRATFQRVIPRPGAMLDLGTVLRDPLLYRDFFERLSQSLFLTANEI